MREGWTYKKSGSTPSTKDAANYASPDYCFVKPSDLPSTGIAVIDDSEFHISAKAFESARQLPKGSIVVSCIGIIGKVGILNKDACTNQQINAIIPNGTIMPKCLAYIICYKKSELEQIANAPVVPIINKGEYYTPKTIVNLIAEMIDNSTRKLKTLRTSIPLISQDGKLKTIRICQKTRI